MRQWAVARPVPITVVLGLIGGMAAAYLAIDADTGPEPAWHRLAQDLVPSAVVALLAYLTVNYLLFHQNAANTREFTDALARRIADLRPRPDNGIVDAFPSRVPWTRFVGPKRDAIVLFARVWDDEAASVRRNLSDFFARGGTLEVFLCDPEDRTAVDACARERSKDMQPDRRQIRRRILRTVCELQAAHDRARKENRWVRANQLVMRYVPRAANYSLAIFEGQSGRHAVIAPSPHFYLPEAPPISLCVDLAVAWPLAEFLDGELSLMREPARARLVDVAEAREQYARLRASDEPGDAAAVERR